MAQKYPDAFTPDSEYPEAFTPDPPSGSGYKDPQGRDVLTALGRGTVGLVKGGMGWLDALTSPLENDSPIGLKAALPVAQQRLSELDKWIASFGSPESQAAHQELGQAQTWGDTFGTVGRNPGLIPDTVVQAIPSIVGGAGIARGLVGKVAPRVAGAIGEGLIGFGQQAAQTREDTGELNPWQALLAAGSGAVTGLTSLAGGAAANRLGLPDPDVILADPTSSYSSKILARLGGAGVEAGEEALQSGQEAAASNLAARRPIGQGVGPASVMGGVTGGLIGGALSGGRPPAPPPAAPQPPSYPPNDLQQQDLLQGVPPDTMGVQQDLPFPPRYREAGDREVRWLDEPYLPYTEGPQQQGLGIDSIGGAPRRLDILPPDLGIGPIGGTPHPFTEEELINQALQEAQPPAAPPAASIATTEQQSKWMQAADAITDQTPPVAAPSALGPKRPKFDAAGNKLQYIPREKFKEDPSLYKDLQDKGWTLINANDNGFMTFMKKLAVEEEGSFDPYMFFPKRMRPSFADRPDKVPLHGDEQVPDLAYQADEGVMSGREYSENLLERGAITREEINEETRTRPEEIMNGIVTDDPSILEEAKTIYNETDPQRIVENLTRYAAIEREATARFNQAASNQSRHDVPIPQEIGNAQHNAQRLNNLARAKYERAGVRAVEGKPETLADMVGRFWSEDTGTFDLDAIIRWVRSKFAAKPELDARGQMRAQYDAAYKAKVAEWEARGRNFDPSDPKAVYKWMQEGDAIFDEYSENVAQDIESEGIRANWQINKFLRGEEGTFDPQQMWENLKRLLGRDPTPEEVQQGMDRQVQEGEETGRVAPFAGQPGSPEFEAMAGEYDNQITTRAGKESLEMMRQIEEERRRGQTITQGEPPDPYVDDSPYGPQPDIPPLDEWDVETTVTHHGDSPEAADLLRREIRDLEERIANPELKPDGTRRYSDRVYDLDRQNLAEAKADLAALEARLGPSKPEFRPDPYTNEGFPSEDMLMEAIPGFDSPRPPMEQLPFGPMRVQPQPEPPLIRQEMEALRARQILGENWGETRQPEQLSMEGQMTDTEISNYLRGEDATPPEMNDISLIKRLVEEEEGTFDPAALWRNFKGATGVGQGRARVAPKKSQGQYNFFKEALAVPTNAMTTLDLSPAGRQGLLLFNTPQYWTSLIKSFGALHYGTWQKIDANTRQRPNWETKIDPKTQKVIPSIANRAGLTLYSPASEPGPRAEQVASRWIETGAFLGPEKIFGKVENPVRWGYNKSLGAGIRATNRFYVTFLNLLQASRFDYLMDRARDMSYQALTTGRAPRTDLLGSLGVKKNYNTKEAMELDPYYNDILAAEIGSFIGAAIGQGKARNQLERGIQAIGPALFSPGLLISRVRMLNPGTYLMASPYVRKQYLKAAIGAAMGWFIFNQMAKVAADAMGQDAEINYDHTSADFGKFRVGDTRLDFGGGFLQFAVLLGRAAEGGWTSSSNPEEGFHKFGEGYQPETQLSNLNRFISNKYNPVVKFAYDIADTAENKPVYMGDRIIQSFVPLFVQDLIELGTKSPELVPWLVPILFGAGTQTYGKFNDPTAEGETIFTDPEQDWKIEGGGIRDLIGFPREEEF